MATGSIQVEFSNMWGVNLIVALSSQMTGDEVLQFVANNRTSWCPKNEALSNHLINVEELQILAQLSMTSLGSLTHQRPMIL